MKTPETCIHSKLSQNFICDTTVSQFDILIVTPSLEFSHMATGYEKVSSCRVWASLSDMTWDVWQKLFISCVSLNLCVQLTGYSEGPVSLLLFIGTMDDRCLRPHAFYQVHRVTGKMVTTSCQEKMMGFTKVLEIPLLPENDMAAR